MAQTIKHRRGKLESVKDITPINGELIIASGSDLSVHQEGLLFVGVEGNALTPSNKILTGSATLDVTTNDYDHSIDGVPYYETDAQKLTILGHGGNTDVTLIHGQIDFKGSGIVSSSSQVSALAGINDSTLTITAGDGLKTGGTFTTNQSGDTSVTLDIDVSDFAGTGLDADGSENLNINPSYLNTSLNSFTASNANTSLNAATSSYLTAAGISDTAIVQGADSLVFFDATDSGVKRESIGDFLSAIAGTGISVSSNQLTATSGDITGVTAGSGLSGGGNSGTVVVGVDSGSLAGSGLVAPAGGAINLNVDDSTIEINSDTVRIKDDGVTYAKVQNVAANNVLLGNDDGAGSAIQELTAANVRTIINVENGATADQTKSDIDGLAITTVGTLDTGDATGIVSAASATVAGKVELATTAETTTGTDATRAVTPDGLKDGYQGSANVTTLGTITTGTWTGTAIAKANLDDEVLNASLNSFTSSAGNVVTLDVGVGNTNVLQAGTGIADDDFLRVNGSTIEGRSASQVLSDIGAQASLSSTSITIGDSTISLGSTDTTLTGLTDIDMTAGDHTIFDTVGANTLTVGASTTDVVIAGNLTVSGTRTVVNTTTVQYDDNILELNGGGSDNGGIQVKDAEGATNVTGSLIWDTGADYWSAGPVGSEKEITRYNADPTTNNVQKVNSSNLLVDSALSDDGTAVTISSDLIISGLTASQVVVTNGSKQLVSSTDISSLTLTLDGGQF